MDVETGLYDMRARLYDPKVGRFLSQDTYPMDGFNPGTIHRYSYAFNNPVNFIDPSGHFPEKIDELAKKFIETQDPNLLEELNSMLQQMGDSGEGDIESLPLWEDPAFIATFASTFAAVRAIQATSAVYWRYISGKSDPNSKWLTKGKFGRPPYGKNFDKAQDKLQIPEKPTGLEKIKAPRNEPISGPREASGHPEWGQGGGPEYYRGPNFPY